MSFKRAYNILAFATGHAVLGAIIAVGCAAAGVAIANKLCKKPDYDEDLDFEDFEDLDDISDTAGNSDSEADAAFDDEVVPNEEVPCSGEPDDVEGEGE